MAFKHNPLCRQEAAWGEIASIPVDTGKCETLIFNTLLKCRYPKLIKKVLEKLEVINSFTGAGRYFKIRILVEIGLIDVLIQRIDGYLLGAIRDGVVYECASKAKRFIASETLPFTERYPPLSGLEFGLKKFKQAVRNVILNAPSTWLYDLVLITVTICEGSRFNPFHKLMSHLMREEQDIPWKIKTPFPDAFLNWSKMSKNAGDSIKESIATGQPIVYDRHKVPKLNGMEISRLNELVDTEKDGPFAISCLKWPQPRSFDLGSGKGKEEWLYSVPQKRHSKLLEDIRHHGYQPSSEESEEHGSGQVNKIKKYAGGGRSTNSGKKRVSRQRVDSRKQSRDIACSSSKVNGTIFNGSLSPKPANSEAAVSYTKYTCSVGSIVCEVIKSERYTGTKRFSADTLVAGTISASDASEKNKNPVNPSGSTNCAFLIGSIMCEVVKRDGLLLPTQNTEVLGEPANAEATRSKTPWEKKVHDQSKQKLVYGEIVDGNLVRDRGAGKSKGFAFVAYEDQRSTVLTVDNLNGAQVTKYKKKEEEEDEEKEQRKREKRGVCRAFQRGECTRGAGCKFSHIEQRAANTSWGAEDAKKEKRKDSDRKQTYVHSSDRRSGQGR